MTKETRVTMRKFVDKMAALEPDRWHQLTMQMAWHFRTDGAKDVPAVIVAGFLGELPTREAWDTLRQQVNARRKAAKSEERRYLSKRAREHRQRYMREYMQKYRAKQANV